MTGKLVVTPEEEHNHLHEGSEFRDFLSDEKVMVNLDKDFGRTLLPSRFAEDPTLIDEIAKDLAKDEDLTNPRPDIIFGLQRDKYPLATEVQIPQPILDLLEIAPGIHHAFLIIEGKSHSGSSATAENQARRGGVPRAPSRFDGLYTTSLNMVSGLGVNRTRRARRRFQIPRSDQCRMSNDEGSLRQAQTIVQTSLRHAPDSDIRRGQRF